MLSWIFFYPVDWLQYVTGFFFLQQMNVGNGRIIENLHNFQCESICRIKLEHKGQKFVEDEVHEINTGIAKPKLAVGYPTRQKKYDYSRMCFLDTFFISSVVEKHVP